MQYATLSKLVNLRPKRRLLEKTGVFSSYREYLFIFQYMILHKYTQPFLPVLYNRYRHCLSWWRIFMRKCLFFGIVTGGRLLFCFRVVSLWFMVGERHLYNESGTRRTVVIAVFADIPDSLLYCYSYALPVREKSEFLFQIFSCDALFTFGHLLRCSAAY